MRLADAYDAFLIDLDGVLHRGDVVIEGAPQALTALREAGRALAFLTNNSSRTPAQVAERLTGMGLDIDPAEVVTSARATARLVAAEAEDGRTPSAFVIGEEGLRAALAEEGIEVLEGDPSEAGFVIVGWDRGVTYHRLRTASVLVRGGARFVASNLDATYPAPGGELWPGAGSLAAAVQTASGAAPSVAGKPHPPLFEEALERTGARRALVVGDRLDTDVAGAAAAGLDSVLVLSGAATQRDLLDHPAQPRAVLPTISGLLDERPATEVRAARPEDLEGLRSLVVEAGLDPAELEPGVEGTVVATGDGRVLATASVDTEGTEGYLRSVTVAERERGSRLGTLVVASAVRRAVGIGIGTLYLLTESAAGFFERLGFEQVDRSELPSWVADRGRRCAESATAMRRSVA